MPINIIILCFHCIDYFKMELRSTSELFKLICLTFVVHNVLNNKHKIKSKIKFSCVLNKNCFSTNILPGVPQAIKGWETVAYVIIFK